VGETPDTEPQVPSLLLGRLEPALVLVVARDGVDLRVDPFQEVLVEPGVGRRLRLREEAV